MYGLIERGAMQRATGTTKLNELSSRSHAVFIIIVEKSTVPSEEAHANGEEMERFRGVAPGAHTMLILHVAISSHRWTAAWAPTH